jgi:hypothetical protein
VSDEGRWAKLEEIVRRVIREEIAGLGKKPKIELVNGKWVGITQDQREAWLAAYGAVDLEAELKTAAAWCVSNPSLAPKSQIGRFLNTWLTREQNRRSLQSIPNTRQSPMSIQKKTCAYCPKGSVGNRNGYEHCDDHAMAALDGDKPMGAVRQRA